MIESEIQCEYDYEVYMNSKQNEQKLDIYEEYNSEMAMWLIKYSQAFHEIFPNDLEAIEKEKDCHEFIDENRLFISKNARVPYKKSEEFDNVIYVDFTRNNSDSHHLDSHEGAA